MLADNSKSNALKILKNIADGKIPKSFQIIKKYKKIKGWIRLLDNEDYLCYFRTNKFFTAKELREEKYTPAILMMERHEK